MVLSTWSAASAQPCAGPAWTPGPFFGSHGTFFVDASGDRIADALEVNTDVIGGDGTPIMSVYGRLGLIGGQQFDPTLHLFTHPIPYAPHPVFFIDVTGEGIADLVYQDNNRWVVHTGPSPTPPASWTTNMFYGTHGTYMADVDNDRRADLIAVNSRGIQVRRSTGTSFGPIETWSTQRFVGEYVTAFADVTGDGRADAIAVSFAGTTVRRSGRGGFLAEEPWAPRGFYGEYGTYFADVTGDGKADAIITGSTTGVVVRRSNGVEFDPTDEVWLAPGRFDLPDSLIYTETTQFAPVTDSGRLDLIIVTRTGVYVRPNTGTEFVCN